MASKAREAREAQRLPKGGQPYVDAIAEMTSHAAPGHRADAPLPVLDPPERARATGGRPPEAMPEPTPETVAGRMAGGSGIGEARGGALGAMLKRFADDGLSGMMDELRGGAGARFDGAQVPAASQGTVTQGGIAGSGAVKRFKAGVAVCTTNGGIKRCRIGGDAVRSGAGMRSAGLFHRLDDGIERQHDRGVAVLVLARGAQHLEPVKGRGRGRPVLFEHGLKRIARG